MIAFDQLMGMQEFNLPLQCDKDQSVRELLELKFDLYYKTLSQLDGNLVDCKYAFDNLSKTKEIGDAILLAHDQAMAGKPGAGLTTFAAALNKYKAELDAGLVNILPKAERLYRIRASDKYLYDHKELFHIPFEDRHIAGTQRFSIPGRPSLYLGGSIFICWMEMGRPDFNKIFISEFRPHTQIKVLDMCYNLNFLKEVTNSPTTVYGGCEARKELIDGVLMFWPLLAACSIKRKNKDAKFHPEYVISHFLSEWIVDSGIDGIRYMSTQVDSEAHNGAGDFRTRSNCYFPAQENLPKGFCGILSAKFEMTPPAPFEIIKTVKSGRDHKIVSSEQIEIGKGYKVGMGKTEFYAVQFNLQDAPLALCGDVLKPPSP